VRQDIIWQRDGRYFDALRPTVEPDGLSSPDEVFSQRLDHITCLHDLFKSTDIFIFTLGLTEYWTAQFSGLAYPTCPGVVAGEYCADQHSLHNASYPEVQGELIDAFSGFKSLKFSILKAK